MNFEGYKPISLMTNLLFQDRMKTKCNLKNNLISKSVFRVWRCKQLLSSATFNANAVLSRTFPCSTAYLFLSQSMQGSTRTVNNND